MTAEQLEWATIDRLKGTLEELIRRFGGVVVERVGGVRSTSFYSTKSTATDRAEVYLADTNRPLGPKLGEFGLLPKGLVETFGLKQQLAFLDIDLGALSARMFEPPQAAPIPVHPAIARDVALTVQENTTWDRIVEKAAEKSHEWRSSPEFVSLYRGKQLGPDKKSVAFRVEYRAPDRTLTDEDVKGPHDEFVRKLCAALGAQIRK